MQQQKISRCVMTGNVEHEDEQKTHVKLVNNNMKLALCTPLVKKAAG